MLCNSTTQSPGMEWPTSVFQHKNQENTFPNEKPIHWAPLRLSGRAAEQRAYNNCRIP